MPPLPEAKPAWRRVPAAVRAQTERILGARVTHALRAYGGYGPSATFRLTLEDGRHAFFKGVYPLPEHSPVIWNLDEEARVYESIGDLLRPWAPKLYGSIRIRGWHALLLEDVEGRRVPPWSAPLARRAARSYAAFHGSTAGLTVPRWLPRDTHAELYTAWHEVSADPTALELLAGAANERAREARSWLSDNLSTLDEAAQRLATAKRGSAILHFDTRSDNIRIQGELLRIFDWPFACVGPPEVDLVAFAQSIASEGGPAPEQIAAWYSEVHWLRSAMVAASVAGLAGFFALRAPRPDVPDLPRLRSWQRRQLTCCLYWAARALNLAEPAWLEAIAN